MEIQQLIGFEAVARSGSFSAAARLTHRTQPAISLQIKSLENELGVRLFDREPRGNTTLTAEGRFLLEHVAGLLSEFAAIKSRIDDYRGRTEHINVTLATHTSVMTHLLPESVSQFHNRYPTAQLSILNRSREEIVELVKNGTVDFGILSLSTVPATLNYRVFGRFKRLLLANKERKLPRKLRLSDVAAFPLILPPVGSLTRTEIEQVLNRANLSPKVTLEIASREAVKQYVSMGLGVSIVNEYYLNAADRKRFKVVDVSDLFGSAERGVLTKRNRYLGRGAEELIRLILD